MPFLRQNASMNCSVGASECTRVGKFDRMEARDVSAVYGAACARYACGWGSRVIMDPVVCGRTELPSPGHCLAPGPPIVSAGGSSIDCWNSASAVLLLLSPSLLLPLSRPLPPPLLLPPLPPPLSPPRPPPQPQPPPPQPPPRPPPQPLLLLPPKLPAAVWARGSELPLPAASLRFNGRPSAKRHDISLGFRILGRSMKEADPEPNDVDAPEIGIVALPFLPTLTTPPRLVSKPLVSYHIQACMYLHITNGDPDHKVKWQAAVGA